MATFKHISSKNADYGAAEQYLTFEHDEFTMKPTLDENGRLVLRDDYRISSLNCGGEDFAISCMRSNLKYGKNQKREDVKSHHYIISFDPRDAADNGLNVDRAQELGEQFCKQHMLYSNILLKMYLKSLKNGGKLQLAENIPYTPQMIATITRQQVGTVERALQIFMKLGLVEPLRNGALYMSNIELLIGQSSTEGERKRRARLALQAQKALPETVADKRPPDRADICPPEIEIEKEIDIELEIKREGEIKSGQTAPAPFGRYENVFLTEKELAELKEELPGKWEYYIDRLSGYIASTGKNYKNHAATIRRWAADDKAKGKNPKKGIPDYSCKEGESL